MSEIKNVINEWDPIGLMKHAPDDEYEVEIEQIAEKLYNIDTVEELANIVGEIFLQAFGNDMFNKSAEECMTVAEKIWMNR